MVVPGQVEGTSRGIIETPHLTAETAGRIDDVVLKRVAMHVLLRVVPFARTAAVLIRSQLKLANIEDVIHNRVVDAPVNLDAIFPGTVNDIAGYERVGLIFVKVYALAS
jgi:hypothetical protein